VAALYKVVYLTHCSEACGGRQVPACGGGQLLRFGGVRVTPLCMTDNGLAFTAVAARRKMLLTDGGEG